MDRKDSMDEKRTWPKPIYSPGLRGAVQEILQSDSHKRLMRLLGLIPRTQPRDGEERP